MVCLRLSFVRNIVCAGVVASLFFGAPMQLAAQERESSAAPRASVMEWVSGIWNDLTALFMGRCAVDPNGCPIDPVPATDGRCAVDPNGCSGG